MTEIGFYHLKTSPLERALPRLVERALGAGHKVLVMATSRERIEALDRALWTFDEASFLPHGSAATGLAERQPVWLTSMDENPNGADLLILTDGAESTALASFARCLDLFDGNDAEAVALARRRWAAAKAAGHNLTYWQQTDAGGWARKE